MHAGCSLCPAWDIKGAFDRLSSDAPIVDAILTKSIKRFFVRRNEALLSA